jgi:adenylate cyclase
VRANLQQARNRATQLLVLSEALGEPLMLHAAHIMLAYTRGHLGELRPALDHLAVAASYEQPGYSAFYRSVSALDPGVARLAQEGRLLWLVGEPDRALDKVNEALGRARQMAVPNTIGFALVWAGYVHQMRVEREQVRQCAREALALAAEHGLADVAGWATLLDGWASDDPGSAARAMSASLAAQRTFGSEIARPHQLALLAEVHLRVGDTDAALLTLDDAADQAAATGDRYYEAEVHRLIGTARLARGELTLAHDQFQRALKLARLQGAGSFEARAVASLAQH